MTFDDFISKAWNDHASGIEEVASRLKTQDASTSAETIALAGLVTHVYGEHLARYDEGVAVLGGISTFDSASEQAVTRSQAALEIAGGAEFAAGFSVSDQIRIFAVASSALVSRNVARATELFRRALDLAESDLAPDNPAIRALAVTGNNLACSLEDAPARTWIHVERAEYRLANSYLKAGDRAAALSHAQECLRLCLANGADDVELKYANELLDLVKRS